MKKAFLLFIFLLIVASIFAQKEKKSLYSGGMLFLQPGITFATNEKQDIRNLSFSIGGILRMYFCKYLTAGVFGGNVKTEYLTRGSGNSYLYLGYGGPFLGVSIESGKFRYTASAFGGIGSFRNLHIDNQAGTDLVDANFYKGSAFVYSPLLSLDYAITRRIYLTAQTVCLMGKYNGNLFYNPTFQLGILFSR